MAPYYTLCQQTEISESFLRYKLGQTEGAVFSVSLERNLYMA